MLEEYYQFKRSYPEFVLMIKAGNFYEILDKDAVIENRKIVNEKTFENNIYHTFLFDMNHIKYHLIRINKIIKYLNENMDCNNDEMLEKIESIIYGR